MFRDLLPKLPDKPTIYLDTIDPAALVPLLAFMYGGEAKVTKNLLKDFMEAANILKIDGLSDNEEVEKAKQNPVLLESLKEKREEIFESNSDESIQSSGLSCTICGFVTTAR